MKCIFYQATLDPKDFAWKLSGSLYCIVSERLSELCTCTWTLETVKKKKKVQGKVHLINLLVFFSSMSWGNV